MCCPSQKYNVCVKAELAAGPDGFLYMTKMARWNELAQCDENEDLCNQKALFIRVFSFFLNKTRYHTVSYTENGLMEDIQKFTKAFIPRLKQGNNIESYIRQRETRNEIANCN